MQDIFISQQPTLLLSWSAAFPNAWLATEAVLPASDAKSTAFNKLEHKPVIFWLHMNPDRQTWLNNTIKTIQAHYKKAKIVVLANVPVQAEAMYVLQLGVSGYTHAYIDPAVLKEIKTVISHGGLWIGQDILQRLIEVTVTMTGSGAGHVEAMLNKLTAREKDVALEAAKGLSNKEIARVLDITERTVKAHLAAAFSKIGAKDRLQLALMLNTNPVVKH